jgi:V/A-type H+-transporting ATPase subunit E
VGYPELLRVLGEEAAREARDVRAAAEREAIAVVAEARRGAAAARDALLARERADAEGHRRAALDALGLERDRALLVERRRLVEELRQEILRRLPGEGSPALDARLVAEVLPEADHEPIELVVDPGAEAEARATLERLAPALLDRAVVRAADAARGGVELVVGRLVLDDTLPSRLERAWPAIEAELAALLLEER